MSTVIDVPLNTAIADLDEGLRGLLRSELRRHGFDGVEISFDAPSREWAGRLTGPGVNLFLYDIREARDRATSTPETRAVSGEGFMVSPALRLALTYAVTAWTKAVEDEHRLLSQVLAILFSHARLPDDVLGASPSGVRGPVDAAVGRPREDKSDFWSAVGGQYKASIDYVVQIAIESGARFERGLEVRTRDDPRAPLRGPSGQRGGAAWPGRHGARRAGRAGCARLGRPARAGRLGGERSCGSLPVYPRRTRDPPRAGRARSPDTRPRRKVTVPGPGVDVVVPNAPKRRKSAA